MQGGPGSEPTSGQRADVVPLLVGGVGCAAAVLGYLLEMIRQRGTCELGDPSPDTLAISVGLILVGGGLLGLVGVGMALVRIVRSHDGRVRLGLVVSVVSVLLGASLFAFAGSGPGGWFQYCGS